MAPAKQEAPSPMVLLDQHVDRRAALVKRRFELEEQMPKLRQAWTEAAATADPSDDLPAQRAFEAAERELKNVDAALVGIEHKIDTTRQEIGRAQDAARCAQACREAKAMKGEAQAMEDSFRQFIGHATKVIGHHDQCRKLVGTTDQLLGLAYWVEQQLLASGFPDLNEARKQTHFHGEGTSPTQAAESVAVMVETR